MQFKRDRAVKRPVLYSVHAEDFRADDAVAALQALQLRERLAASLEERPDLTDDRWTPRSALVLIVGVGLAFWGTIYWLIFG